MAWERPFQQVDCVTLTLTPPGENVRTLFRGERVASISCCFSWVFFFLNCLWNFGTWEGGGDAKTRWKVWIWWIRKGL